MLFLLVFLLASCNEEIYIKLYDVVEEKRYANMIYGFCTCKIEY